MGLHEKIMNALTRPVTGTVTVAEDNFFVETADHPASTYGQFPKRERVPFLKIGETEIPLHGEPEYLNEIVEAGKTGTAEFTGVKRPSSLLGFGLGGNKFISGVMRTNGHAYQITADYKLPKNECVTIQPLA